MPDFAGGFPSLASMARMLRSGECTSVDLVQQSLRRIRELDERLHAFVAVYTEDALLAAQAADLQIRAGFALGPLHGIPVALKDNIDVRGRPTTAGSPARSGEVASSHAWVTQRLLECGAVIVGKTHMVEFAMGAWGTNEHMGAPRNPWGEDEHLSPGGSSSGSAVAVAAGMVPLAIGTDTGASIRVPASLCGITGLKPTIGRLPADGVVPLSTTHDSVGVMAHTAEDAALMFGVLARDDRACPGKLPSLRGLRAGYLRESDLEGVEPAVLAAYGRALDTFREQGAQLRELSFPIALDKFASVAGDIVLSEAAASWADLALDDTRKMDAAIRSRMVAGSKLLAVDYVRARRRREALKSEFAESFGDLDVFLTPSSPWTAKPVSRVDPAKVPVKYSRVLNLLDLCGISVQMGEDEEGLPIGLQIASATNEDARILDAARAWQACTTWHERRWFPRA